MESTQNQGASPATVLASELAGQGATVAFGVPGGGANLDVVGALEQNAIRFVLAHSETASCIMASTWGWLTGSVTAAVVTRGPGAASAVNGAAQATLDRQPLILVTDTVPEQSRARVPHQRIDQRAMLGPVSKATEVLGHDASASHVEAAITMACSEPAGAVHLDYDMSGTTTAGEPPAPTTPSEESTIAQAQTLIADATQPVVIIGIGALTDAQPVRDVLIDLGAPVFSTYQATGVLSSEHDLSAGLFTNGASERAILDQADLIITIGLDLVEPIPAAWTYDAPVVAISGCPAQDRYMPTAVEVVGDVADLVPRLLAASQEHKWNPTAGSSHRETVRKRFLAGEPSDVFGPLGLTNTVAALAPRQATVTVDAGAHFLAIMPFWPVTAPKHLLISNGLATMGYAVPAAIGAAFARPDQPVVALTGDGGLGMCLAELETIARHSLPIAVVVYNDAALSLIKIKQRNGHGGDSVVHYAPTDFAAVALGMGIESAIATSADDIERLLAGHGFDRPLLIDARIDPSSYPHLMTVTRG